MAREYDNIAGAISAVNDEVGEQSGKIADILEALEGKAGGGLPSSISKIDGGSFTLASDTVCNTHSISHNLGVAPKGFVVRSDDVNYGGAEDYYILVQCYVSDVDVSATQKGTYFQTRKASDGTFGNNQGNISNSAFNDWFSSNGICVNITSRFKAGCTYKWIAWA